MHGTLLRASARRLLAGGALLVGLAALIAALSSTTGAQQPPAPHWFWGTDLDSYAGAEVVAINQDGVAVASTTVNADGEWSLIVETTSAVTVKLRLVSDSGIRETDSIDVVEAGFDSDGASISDFHTTVSQSDMEVVETADTITVRIIARRADDGRIEFGMRDQNGEDILPRARFFPNGGPGHGRWLQSTLIDFGGGFEGRIIARYVESDGRTEFGFRVAGYDDIFPKARFLPATGPDHNRWLRSSEIEVSAPR